jgi:hypothetical protein
MVLHEHRPNILISGSGEKKRCTRVVQKAFWVCRVSLIKFALRLMDILNQCEEKRVRGINKRIEDPGGQWRGGNQRGSEGSMAGSHFPSLMNDFRVYKSPSETLPPNTPAMH